MTRASAAWLFPGQGAQYVGMAASLLARHETVRRLYQAARERTGVDFALLSSEGPREELVKTSNTQPAIYLHSVALALLLRERGWRPAAVAGHSLGEYSALAAAGWLDPLDGLALVRRRGELMYQAGLDWPGTMAAVIGAAPELVEECCRLATAEGEVAQPANFNCPGQIAISGSLAGVERTTALLKERGVRLVKRLDVSGAFHSPLMEAAREGLLRELADVALQPGVAPLYCNVTGRRVEDAGQIRTLLGRQLTETVRWQGAMESLAADGHREALELGPGKVLSGLMQRIDGEFRVRPVDTADELEALWQEGS
ncbi:MAG: ACP S-malonyltransferase [bacterium]|nr:ACP S-malonyltransferase [bacterium]